MTKEEQRIAIAKACPRLFWIHKATAGGRPWIRVYRVGEDPSYGAHPCDPTNDLNAIHDAEMWHVDLEDGHFVTLFREHLHTILGHDGTLAIHATAAQRCEAFLKTLGLWTP